MKAILLASVSATLLLWCTTARSNTPPGDSAAIIEGASESAVSNSPAPEISSDAPAISSDAPEISSDAVDEVPGVPASPEDSDALPPRENVAAGEQAKPDFIQRSNLILSKIMASTRILDPFGMSMDPANFTELPTLAEDLLEAEETPALNNSSLKIAVGKLPITGVYPKKQMVVVGPRSFSPGDELGLRAEGLTIRLRFEGIRGQSVYFRDVETNEVTSVDFNTRPVEFEPIAPGSKRGPGEGIEAMTGLFIAN